MNKLILIDSNILIWGIKGYATAGQRDNIDTAKSFLKWISDNDYKMLMPVPQLVELMSYCAPALQDELRKLFTTKSFEVAPFDELAANKCAELIFRSLNEPLLKEYREQHLVPRNKIKFDCMIAATAIVRGATKIFSHDNDMKKFSCGQIEVSQMPVFGSQENLFGEKSIPRIISLGK